MTSGSVDPDPGKISLPRGRREISSTSRCGSYGRLDILVNNAGMHFAQADSRDDRRGFRSGDGD